MPDDLFEFCGFDTTEPTKVIETPVTRDLQNNVEKPENIVKNIVKTVYNKVEENPKPLETPLKLVKSYTVRVTEAQAQHVERLKAELLSKYPTLTANEATLKVIKTL